MKTKPLLERERHHIVATLLGIPLPFVRQVSYRLKTDDRIAATRPVAAPITPLSLSRLIMGLCAPIPSRASDIEQKLGALPRQTGDGADIAEAELERLIAEAAGITDGDIDFWRGDLLVGVDGLSVLVSLRTFDGASKVRIYRRGEGEDDRMTRFVRLPLQTLRMLALELMGD